MVVRGGAYSRKPLLIIILLLITPGGIWKLWLVPVPLLVVGYAIFRAVARRTDLQECAKAANFGEHLLHDVRCIGCANCIGVADSSRIHRRVLT
jgi:hypothetical protein